MNDQYFKETSTETGTNFCTIDDIKLAPPAMQICDNSNPRRKRGSNIDSISAWGKLFWEADPEVSDDVLEDALLRHCGSQNHSIPEK